MKFAARFRFDGSPVAVSELQAILPLLGAAPRLPVRTGPFYVIAASDSAVASAAGLAVVFAGRVDNRAELTLRLGSYGAVRDSELVLAAFLAWREAAFDRIIGPFVAVIVDERARSVSLVRDSLGGRALFLRRSGAALTLASRPYALAGLDGRSIEIDEASVARYLTGSGPRPGATFFRGVEELPPGALVRLGSAGEDVRSLAITPAPPPGRGSERDYEERFRELLDEAVDCRLPAEGETAVLMSGGLDSTSVAAAAAHRLALRGSSPPFTISWVFDELPRIDERRWIEPANRASGARPLFVPADELFPLADTGSWPQPLDAPVQGPYFRMRQRSFELAHGVGAPVLLAGESADDLWTTGVDWLRDAVISGHWGAAAAGLARGAISTLAGQRPKPSLRVSMGRLVRPRGHREIERSAPWLTPWASSRIEEEVGTSPGPRWHEFRAPPSGLAFPLDLALLRFAEEESAPSGVEIRRPFRDRRLVEFFRSVPPRFLHRTGEPKRLLRRAMRGRLPREVLHRRDATTLLPLFERGFAERGRAALHSTLSDREAVWPRFVRRDWVLDRAFGALGSGRDVIELLILWHCWCLEIWLRALGKHVAPLSGSG